MVQQRQHAVMVVAGKVGGGGNLSEVRSKAAIFGKPDPNVVQGGEAERLPVRRVDRRTVLHVGLIARRQGGSPAEALASRHITRTLSGWQDAAIMHLHVDARGDRRGRVRRDILQIVVERVDEVEEVDRVPERELIVAVHIRRIQLDVGAAPMRDGWPC